MSAIAKLFFIKTVMPVKKDNKKLWHKISKDELISVRTLYELDLLCTFIPI